MQAQHKRSVEAVATKPSTQQPAAKKPRHSAQLLDASHGDLTLIVNDRHQFYVHRALLSVWSPVWSSMLSNGMKETSQTTVHLREDEEEHVEHFGTFLDFMYPYSAITINAENVDALLHLADKYRVQPRVNQMCEAFLLTIPCGRKSVGLLLKAQKFGLDELMTRHAIWLGKDKARKAPLEQMNCEALRICITSAFEEISQLREQVSDLEADVYRTKIYDGSSD